MLNLLAVATGGALGALLRYALTSAVSLTGVAFPLGTLLVNCLGSLAIGVLAALWMFTGEPVPQVRLLFQTGVLGAFTTFSAFSLDTLLLWQNGQFYAAGFNVAVNVLLCLLLVAAGWAIGTALHR